MNRRAAGSTPPLVVVGASVRAIAASARRAGWSVHAADLFVDADLDAVATAAVRVPTSPALPWPAGVVSALEPFPVAPWIYTGALENHPDLVDRLAGARPLAGNAGDRLRHVRDPALLARAVRAAGLGFPETFTDPAGLPTDGSFLVKPRAGAGGRGIARWRGGPVAGSGRIWQRFLTGRAWSVAFAIDAAGARLFGASLQILGRRWCGARGFTYCGSIDLPLASVPAALRTRFDRLGTLLADVFGLVGLVGADLVVDRARGVHVIEVNPRPTSSLELVERATGASVAATHLAACGFPSPTRNATPGAVPSSWAKAVVFADHPTTFGGETVVALERLSAPWREAAGGWSVVADLPHAGATIDPGAPVLTVFAAADDATAALRSLRARVAAIRAALRDPRVSPPAVVAGPPPRPRRPGNTA